MIRRTFLNVSCCAAIALLGNCDSVQADNGDSVFEYREIYLPDSNSDKAAKLQLNSLDTDWGIWGHNLSKVLPAKPSQTIYAKVDGATNTGQFCFMSDRLYEYIEEYIDDHYGRDEEARFAILPNDNELVCMCAKCRAEGNTRKDATPAVLNMIRRLAERFPSYLFFTSYYLTTHAIPEEPLPANSGVLISAMDYPLSAAATSQEQEFVQLLNTWGQKTSRMYVWDYINNFDDYFTPFPVFEVMQRRLKLYADAGVKGVFLNGSGTDYCTLSRLKANVLSLLLRNPSADWRKQVRSLCREFYPVTHDIITRFVLAQEDYVVERGQTLPLYDGVAKALDTYLPEQEFQRAYEQLQLAKSDLSGLEKKNIDRLCAAMELTRLEIKRMKGDVEGSGQMLQHLSSLKDWNIDIYSESSWTVDNYVRDYEFLYHHAENMKGKNLLKGVRLTALTALDPDYSDISILTDGVLGLPSNYHCGHLISSADPMLSIAVPRVDGMRHLRVCMARNKAYRIDLPQQVTLSIGGSRIASAVPQAQPQHSGYSFVEFDLPASVNGTIVLNIVRNPEVRTMAIDEIEGY